MKQPSISYNLIRIAQWALGAMALLWLIFIPFESVQAYAVVTSAKEIDLKLIPPPQTTLRFPKLLSLDDAIALALRNNPVVHSSRFQRISDKYSLELANYAFEPHFNLSGSATVMKHSKPGYNFSPGVSLLTPIGTQLAINHVADFNGHQSEQFEINQPLLRNFGAINRIPWLNAQDNEIVARQNFKSSITDIVTQVITNYRQLVADLNNVRVQKKTLAREQETEKQYLLRIKAGKMARSELLQEQTTLAGIKLEALQQQSQAEQDYQSLLDTLGLSPQSKLNIDTHIDFKDFKPPSKDKAIEIALNNNPPYVIQTLQMNSVRRAVESAKNDLRWQLDLDLQTTFESTNGTIPLLDNSNLVTNTGPSATLTLSIPIRDIDRKAALINAKVGLIQAEDALEQSKRSLIRQVVNDITNLQNQRLQLTIAEQGLALQRQNLASEQIKQRYGQTTALNVNIIQGQLLQQEIDFVSNQISYLNNVTAFENLLGITLDRWDIQLRY